MSINVATNGSTPIELLPPNIIQAAFNDVRKELNPASQTLVIVDHRTLDRECLAKSIRSQTTKMAVVAVQSVEDWKPKESQFPPLAAILVSIGGRKVTEPAVEQEIRALCAQFASVPVILLADTDQLSQIVKALEFGARGFIPSSVGIEVCVEAINLALAGGIFVPASSVLAVRQMFETNEPNPAVTGIFTLRQKEVVEALRRGKANKIIAYELKLRESTVKVHIRNIMKKLKATNRTEVAFKINDIYEHHSM
jgi:DNA-binding NarL/FixJ family response regulator